MPDWAELHLGDTRGGLWSSDPSSVRFRQLRLVQRWRLALLLGDAGYQASHVEHQTAPGYFAFGLIAGIAVRSRRVCDLIVEGEGADGAGR